MKTMHKTPYRKANMKHQSPKKRKHPVGLSHPPFALHLDEVNEVVCSQIQCARNGLTSVM